MNLLNSDSCVAWALSRGRGVGIRTIKDAIGRFATEKCFRHREPPYAERERTGSQSCTRHSGLSMGSRLTDCCGRTGQAATAESAKYWEKSLRRWYSARLFIACRRAGGSRRCRASGGGCRRAHNAQDAAKSQIPVAQLPAGTPRGRVGSPRPKSAANAILDVGGLLAWCGRVMNQVLSRGDVTFARIKAHPHDRI